MAEVVPTLLKAFTTMLSEGATSEFINKGFDALPSHGVKPT